MKKIKLEDIMPRALIRNKDGSFKYPTKARKHVVTTSRQQERSNTDLDALTPQARDYVQRELAARRFSLHWLSDASTRDFVEIAAMQVVEAKRMPDSVKEEFRAAKQQQRIERKEKIASLISIATIAQQLKIIPRVARAALRASKTPKPAHGWAFHPSDVNKIKEIITCQLQTSSSSKLQSSPKASAKLKRTSSGRSSVSTRTTTNMATTTSSTKSTKNSAKPSKKSAAVSGSSKRQTVTSSKTAGRQRGTRRKSSVQKSKRT